MQIPPSETPQQIWVSRKNYTKTARTTRLHRDRLKHASSIKGFQVGKGSNPFKQMIISRIYFFLSDFFVKMY